MFAFIPSTGLPSGFAGRNLSASSAQNWRGTPLLTHQVIVQMIDSTTTQTGLTVQCRLDENAYETGVKRSDEQIARLNTTSANFQGEWNYTIAPRARDGCFG